jgi:hypothetical protein
MDRDELIKYHEELCESARNLMRLKNHDYAGKSAKNPWMNFERSEIMGVCKTEQAFMVRIIDKVSRLVTFIDAGDLAVKEESVTDSIVDIINYMVLFAAFNKDKQATLEKAGFDVQLIKGGAGFLTKSEIEELENTQPI